MKKSIICLVGLMGVSGCLEADQTSSGFKTPSSSGFLSGNSGSQVLSGEAVSSVTGNVYGYQAGAIESAGFQAFSGIAPGASVDAPPPSGSARFDGTFEVAVVHYIWQGDTTLTGSNSLDRGDITLTADFTNKTLTGQGVGQDAGLGNVFLNNNVLAVDGRISGGELSGTVTYNDVSGPLTGLVGANEAIGAFHGNTDHQVHAGGFIAN